MLFTLLTGTNGNSALRYLSTEQNGAAAIKNQKPRTKGEQGKDRNVYIIHINVNKKDKKHELSGQSTSNGIHNQNNQAEYDTGNLKPKALMKSDLHQCLAASLLQGY
ncbi:MAG: hypothetical protein FJY09_04430 [Chlorobi bacterium]|nr:hypothetical protein [Chlorobiota bacterium]